MAGAYTDRSEDPPGGWPSLAGRIIRPVSSTSYSGPVRILDTNGVLLTIGTVDAIADEGLGSWGGTLEVVSGTGVAGKALVVDLVAENGRGRAQLVPIDNNGIMAHSRVVGLGPFPF